MSTVSELKERLKRVGMYSSGTKPELERRWRLHRDLKYGRGADGMNGESMKWFTTDAIKDLARLHHVKYGGSKTSVWNGLRAHLQSHGGKRHSDKKPSGKKASSGKKPSVKKPSGKKHSSKKTSASGKKPSGKKHSGKPSGKKHSSKKKSASGKKPSGKKHSGKKPSGKKHSSGKKPASKKKQSSEKKQSPSGKKPSGKKPKCYTINELKQMLDTILVPKATKPKASPKKSSSKKKASPKKSSSKKKASPKKSSGKKKDKKWSMKLSSRIGSEEQRFLKHYDPHEKMSKQDTVAHTEWMLNAQSIIESGADAKEMAEDLVLMSNDFNLALRKESIDPFVPYAKVLQKVAVETLGMSKKKQKDWVDGIIADVMAEIRRMRLAKGSKFDALQRQVDSNFKKPKSKDDYEGGDARRDEDLEDEDDDDFDPEATETEDEDDDEDDDMED